MAAKLKGSKGKVKKKSGGGGKGASKSRVYVRY
jgi:hypothetical protein